MNLIDARIVAVLESPRQVVDEELCCWEVKVLTDCYGCEKERTFRATSKTEIDRYKKGYTWMT